jgi:hypothetical protein
MLNSVIFLHISNTFFTLEAEKGPEPFAFDVRLQQDHEKKFTSRDHAAYAKRLLYPFFEGEIGF